MATIHHVARRANVSIKTVSRVLNGGEQVRPQTKSIVEQAIRELDYTPHGGARSMRSRRSGLIAMITGAISSAGWVPYRSGLTAIPIVHGALQALRSAGRTLLIADSQGEPEDVAELVRTFHEHRVEGLLYATDHHREVSLGFDLPFPTVLVNCFDGAGTPAIVPDDERAQARVVENMLRSGHGSIGMVGLPVSFVAGRLRQKAFLDGAARAGLPESAVHFAEGAELDESGETSVLPEVLGSMLGAGTPPTAICFGNDLMAMRSMPVLDRMGMGIGRDLAIWGHDNDLTICESVRPMLTTMSLPYHEMGVAAAQCLMSIVESGRTGPMLTKICGDLVERGSSRFAVPRVVNS